MIAKILANSFSYSGIDYNENKVVRGDAELIFTENFGWLESGIIDYVEAIHYKKYFEEWDKRNTRVEKPQFHVTISAKGKYATREQLLDIGREWMKQMGYEGLPTMFYFHNDTKNNHIHIISSRIGRDGKKIDDGNERWRARAIINAICENDIHQKCRDDVARASRYRYESVKQFEAILLSWGYNTKTKNDTIEIWREGQCLLTIKNDIVEHNLASNPVNEKRKKKIQALFYKYSEVMSVEDLKDIMKTQFGIDLIFFGKEKSPYGYTVVDNLDKAVYKGGDIMSLKMLLNRQSNFATKLNSILDIELNRAIPKGTYEINGLLKKYGVMIKGESVIWKTNGMPLIELSEGQLETIAKGNKLAFARKYTLSSQNELEYIANLYKVDKNHLQYDVNADKNYMAVRDLINSGGGRSLKDNIESVGMQVVVSNGELFVFDAVNAQIYEYEKLGLVEDRHISLYESANYERDNDLLPEIDESAETQHLGGSVNNELPKRKRK